MKYIEFKSRVLIFLIIKMTEKKRVTFTIEQKKQIFERREQHPEESFTCNKKMNFSLMNPYFDYLVYFVIATSLIPWAVSFIKNLSYKITICMGVLSYLSIIGFGIFADWRSL